MKVIYGIGPLPKKFPSSVVAIGVFDAVHRGHQKVIRRAVSEARRIGGKSVVLTFYPHPVFVLRPEKFKSYVLALDHRLQLIAECGADVCCVVPFNKSFARMSSGDFVRKILVDGLRARKVIVGRDFHFGHDRFGSFDLLKREGLRYGFSVEALPTLKFRNINIKTKLIKELIIKGDLLTLKRFLGRPYSLFGEVVRGEARGRRIGYRTANLRKENVVILPSGIYCVRVTVGQKKRNGVFYIGSRSTFKSAQKDVALEAHIFDLHENLYGKKVLVEFFKKIRDDRKFSDGESLALQIQKDVARARAFFAKTSLR